MDMNDAPVPELVLVQTTVQIDPPRMISTGPSDMPLTLGAMTPLETLFHHDPLPITIVLKKPGAHLVATHVVLW
jgi:hypothetical protein